MEKHSDFHRTEDVVMIDVNSLRRGRDLNDNERELPNIDPLKVNIEDVKSEDMGDAALNFDAIRSDLLRKIKDEGESNLNFDDSIEIIDEEEEEESHPGIFVETLKEMIDVDDDMYEIKKEYQEFPSPVKIVKSHDPISRAKRPFEESAFLEESGSRCLEALITGYHEDRRTLESLSSIKKGASSTSCTHLQVTPEENQSKLEKPHESQESSTLHKDQRPSTNLGSVSQVVDKEFSYGDLVWAKMKRYPPWPGIIVKEPQSQQFKKDTILYKRGGKTSETKLYFILFFNDNDSVAWIKEADISRYETQSSKKGTRKFAKAVFIADSLSHMSCDDRLRRYAQMQLKNIDDKYLKKKLYEKKYPKLFKLPLVDIERM